MQGNENLVNEDYLQNLIELSKTYDDEGLITQLFKNLQSEYALFLNDCRPYMSDFTQKKEFSFRIHKLKNNFFNLGCEEAGAVLEKMHRALKEDQPSEESLLEMWQELEQDAALTFLELRSALSTH